MIKKYNQYINEGLSDFLKGPTEGEIFKTFKFLSANEILLKSINMGFLNGVKYAIDYGADYYTVMTGLEKCATNNKLDILKYLVENGASIHYNGERCLMNSCRFGHLDIVKYLIAKGANIHYDNDYVLRLSTINGHLDVVKYLVENGANIHADNNGALLIAKQYGYSDIVNYLEEQIAKEKITEGLSDFLTGPSTEEIGNNFKQQFLDKKISMSNYYTKSKQIGFKGPTDDEVMEYYVNTKNYNDLLYFSLRRLKMDMFKIAIEHGANTEDLLQEIYDNDISDIKIFKQIFDIVDINKFPPSDVVKFFFDLYIDQREVIINKLDFNKEPLMGKILNVLSIKTAYKTVDLFFEKGLSDELIIDLLIKTYKDSNIELFKYIIENHEIPYHYDDDKLLYYIVYHRKYHRDKIIDLLLDKDVNIYARDNQMIYNIISGEDSDIYFFFKEKDKKNLLK